jgi:hypothetical protein
MTSRSFISLKACQWRADASYESNIIQQWGFKFKNLTKYEKRKWIIFLVKQIWKVAWHLGHDPAERSSSNFSNLLDQENDPWSSWAQFKVLIANKSILTMFPALRGPTTAGLHLSVRVTKLWFLCNCVRYSSVQNVNSTQYWTADFRATHFGCWSFCVQILSYCIDVPILKLTVPDSPSLAETGSSV